MKTFALSITIFALCTMLWAGNKTGTLPQVLNANGDITAVNVLAGSVAPCTWITLDTNANFKVICQVYYDDNLMPSPSEPDEIEYAHDIEDFLNFRLGQFLSERCNGLSTDELVRDYRGGKVAATLAIDFDGWFRAAAIQTYGDDYKDIVDVDVLAVSMRAVGPFAKALAE